ncbi:M48 family metalloprotease [Halosimplex sp. J119]
MTPETEAEANTSIPTWWLPPVTEDVLSSLLLIHTHSRRVSSSSRPSATSIVDKAGIEDLELSFPSESDEVSETTGLTGNILFTNLYRWKVHQEPSDSWVVTEEVWLYPRWRTVMSFVLMGYILLWLGATIAYGSLINGEVTSFFSLGIAGILAGALFQAMTLILFGLKFGFSQFPEPLSKWDTGSLLTKRTRACVHLSLLIPLLCICVSYAYITGWQAESVSTISGYTLAGMSAVMLTLCCLLFVDYRLQTRLQLANRITMENKGKKGGPVRSLLLTSTFTILAPTVYLVGYQSTIGWYGPEGTYPPDWVIHFLLALFLIGAVLALFKWYRETSFATTWKRDVDIASLSRLRLAIWAGAISLFFWVGALSTLVAAFDLVLSPFWSSELLGRGSFAERAQWYAIALLPFSYMICGLIYQLRRQITRIQAHRRIIDTNPTLSAYAPSFRWESQIDAPVIVTNGDGEPRAVRLPETPAIFLPTETIAALNDDELRAVLAHEESHLRRHGRWFSVSDASLRLVTPFVGTTLGLSQAVLYALFGFRRREYRADQYARARTSAETLLSALNKLAEDAPSSQPPVETACDDTEIPSTDTDGGTLTRDALTGDIGFGTDPRHGEGLFHPLFSSFTVIAHPLLEERKQAIDPDRRSPKDAEDITLRE